jgi:hypothetical protein
MEARVTPHAAQRSRLRAKQKRIDDMLNACHWGDTAAVQRLLDKGVSPDVADYDGKSALFVATVNGKEVCEGHGEGCLGWVRQPLPGASPSRCGCFDCDCYDCSPYIVDHFVLFSWPGCNCCNFPCH